MQHPHVTFSGVSHTTPEAFAQGHLVNTDKMKVEIECVLVLVWIYSELPERGNVAGQTFDSIQTLFEAT